MIPLETTDKYARCPKCSCEYAKPYNMVLWIGIFYHLVFRPLFHPVSCVNCGTVYNGKNGEANFGAMMVFGLFLLVILLFIPALLATFK